MSKMSAVVQRAAELRELERDEEREYKKWLTMEVRAIEGGMLELHDQANVQFEVFRRARDARRKFELEG
jgi:hypothetical protein